VAIVAGTLLPWLNQRDHLLLASSSEDENEVVDEELSRIRARVREWREEAASRSGGGGGGKQPKKTNKLPAMPFMLRNIWTAALILFVVVMASTFFIESVLQATIAISVLGICWAVACWIPFAIIMSFLKEMEDEPEEQNQAAAVAAAATTTIGAPYRNNDMGRRHYRVSSVPSHLNKKKTKNHHSAPPTSMPTPTPNERTQLVRRHSLMSETGAFSHDLRYVGSAPVVVAGGTILGIHNLAIVFPQFLIAIISSAIFRITDRRPVHDPPYNILW